MIKDSSSWSYEYWLKDHLGNVRVTFADNNGDGLITGNERRTRHDYYAFGYEHNGFWKQLETYSPENRYRYNGKEMTEEMDLGMYAYGARWYDPVIGRFNSPDPAANEYPKISPFVYVDNNPIAYIDPDGRRFYFAAGAGHDPGRTGYIGMMLSIFRQSGIQNPVDINAHGGKYSDILFTMGRSQSTPYYNHMYIEGNPIMAAGTSLIQEAPNWRILKAVAEIKSDLTASPLSDGEQFNLSGYSTGSVIMAQAALMLAKEGQIIDNLVLIGSPITGSSDLYNALIKNENIKNIIRIDIEGDNIQNMGIKTLKSFLSQGDDHPHFKYAFDKDAIENTKQLAEELKNKGIR